MWIPLVSLLCVPGVPGAAAAQEGSAPDPSSQWVMPNANYAGWNYSPLDQIDVDNVEQLTMAWTMQLGVHDSYEASPLVLGDTMYIVTREPNYVYALDLARDGFIKWEFRPEIPDSELTRRSACCGAQTRGLGYDDGRIFFATLDGQVFALDAETGEQIWQAENATVAMGETVSGMPLVVGDKVIVGVAGGERGVRGHVTAYNIDDGRFRWRYYSMGPNNEVGIGSRFAPFYPDDRIPNLALDTWSGDSWRRGGGRQAVATASSPPCEPLLSKRFEFRRHFVRQPKLVGDREGVELPREGPRQLPVGLAVDDAGERHMPTIHHDVDRRIRAGAVEPEVGIPVDRTGNNVPQLVIEPRHREHRDLVGHCRHAFERVDAFRDGLRLVSRGNVAGEHDVPLASDLQVDVVEHREERVPEHLFLNSFEQIVLRPVGDRR